MQIRMIIYIHFVIIFEAVCFIHMKLLVEQALSQEFTVDKTVFETLDEFQMFWKRLKFEHRQMRMRTSSDP